MAEMLGLIFSFLISFTLIWKFLSILAFIIHSVSPSFGSMPFIFLSHLNLSLLFHLPLDS